MSETVAARLAGFTTAFDEQVGPGIAAVFRGEQSDLVAAGSPPDAVAIGDIVPDARLVRSDGESTTLARELDRRPAALVFFRGAWCPYCNITLRAYAAELAPALAERGERLVAISPQTPEAGATLESEAALGFPVLSDAGLVLARALGLATEPSAEARAAHATLGFDVADDNVDGTGAVPFPTVLVVDADRRVAFADVHVDYTTRTEPGAVLAALDEVAIPTA